LIIIFGASGGIGRFLFHVFRDSGEMVLGTRFSAKQDELDLVQVDVSDYSNVKEWCDGLLTKGLEKIVLINCAGISFASTLHKSDNTEWKRVIDVNIGGVYNTVRCLLPAMREQGYGRIINFSSVVANISVMGTSAYATSKAALHSFVRSIAIENASKGITANNISLGYSEIGMGQTKITEEMRKDLLERIPAKRFCRPDEILAGVKFLIENQYVNGASIDMDGGLS